MSVLLSSAWREWVDCDNAAEIMATEAEVTKQVIKFLNGEGWTCRRKQVGFFKGRVKVGEVGKPDWQCYDYDIGGWSRVFWLELKGPGEKPSPDQEKWIAAEREKGALVIVADSLESFTSQYAEVYG